MKKGNFHYKIVNKQSKTGNFSMKKLEKREFLEELSIRDIVSRNGKVPIQATIRSHLDEIREMKADGYSYRRIHNALVSGGLATCRYHWFMRVLNRIIRESSGEDTQWEEPQHDVALGPVRRRALPLRHRQAIDSYDPKCPNEHGGKLLIRPLNRQ